MRFILACVAILAFYIPGVQAEEATPTLKPEDLNFKYAIHVPAIDFIPGKVWDDGRFTYIQFQTPGPRELPVFFELPFGTGKPELRNYVYTKDGSMRIDGVFRRGVLKLGASEVVIERL